MGKHRCTPSMLSAARRAREPVSVSWYPGHSPVPLDAGAARDLAAHLIAAGQAGNGPA